MLALSSTHYSQKIVKNPSLSWKLKFFILPSTKLIVSSASSRNSMRLRSPDRMVSSCHNDTMVSSCHTILDNNHEPLMTQSLDPNMLCNTLNKPANQTNLQDVEGTVGIFF